MCPSTARSLPDEPKFMSCWIQKPGPSPPSLSFHPGPCWLGHPSRTEFQQKNKTKITGHRNKSLSSKIIAEKCNRSTNITFVSSPLSKKPWTTFGVSPLLSHGRTAGLQKSATRPRTATISASQCCGARRFELHATNPLHNQPTPQHANPTIHSTTAKSLWFPLLGMRFR